MKQYLHEISLNSFEDEKEAVKNLIESLADVRADYSDIYADAKEMVEHIRKVGLGLSVEAFLQEYGLSSKEGVAVMCMAEALLRIPDNVTADKLIDSTFDGADWEEHLGSSSSFFVNASSWGLLLTGKALDYGVADDGTPTGVFSRLTRSVSEPVIRSSLKAAMRLIAAQFVMGEDTKEALAKAHKLEKQGYLFSYDMLGEGARSEKQASQYFAAYKKAIEDIGKNAKKNSNDKPLFMRPGISIKLTALYPRYESAQYDSVKAILLPRTRELIELAKEKNISVSIDAEEANRLDLELELFQELFEDSKLETYEGLGFVLQAYQKRAIHVVEFLKKLSSDAGRKMPVRLVKGAYWDTEIKQAQLDGLEGYPVFTHKSHSDISYLACAKKLLDNRDFFYPQFATHNALTIAAVRHMAGASQSDSPDYEFQRLYGMGERLYESIKNEVPCRIYAPIGEHKDLLAYLIRRLLENGANSSFVHMVMDKELPINKVLQDPIEDASNNLDNDNNLILPADIYGTSRKNSKGFDVGYHFQKYELEEERNNWKNHNWSKPDDIEVSKIYECVESAKSAQNKWDNIGAESRAIIMEKAADIMEKRRFKLMTLLAEEAGKTWKDALDEVREAVDFLRYYANSSRNLFKPVTLDGPTGEHNQYQLHGKGVFVAISPWNFPLAIFTGQVAAALAAGNAVLAKPAEQTPMIAAMAVQIMHEAGVPGNILQLLCGKGSLVGAALVSNDKISGVVFTGSTETAKNINRTLAKREGAIIPLIAETGGQNCMMVGSSALPEQAVDDIIHSAFGSAGQRCSALRVLYIHEAIADNMIELISGAMDSLVLGDAYEIATDIGPVIDEAAYNMLSSHTEKLDNEKWATHIKTAPYDGDIKNIFSPRMYEIDNIVRLEREIFGPVLHVIRYKGGPEKQVMRDINSTGYGLTFGIHSRIPDFYEEMVKMAKVGNAYINRTMTGAVVGVQPFGGAGLSGTGPKAGGPYYLLRFAEEKTISTNSAAIGGNIELLAG